MEGIKNTPIQKKIDQKTKQLFDETAKRIMKYFLPFALKTKNSTD